MIRKRKSKIGTQEGKKRIGSDKEKRIIKKRD
jgi:hypothetical protein